MFGKVANFLFVGFFWKGKDETSLVDISRLSETKTLLIIETGECFSKIILVSTRFFNNENDETTTFRSFFSDFFEPIAPREELAYNTHRVQGSGWSRF